MPQLMPWTPVLIFAAVGFGGISPAAADAICSDIPAPTPLMGPSSHDTLCEMIDPARAVLVVNTASQCGLTPQFTGLERLYQRYRDQGLVILGFPSDNFGGQEFAAAEQTAEVCYRNFGVTFPMFAAIDVRGDTAHPLFQRLQERSGEAPRWNFHKYLIHDDRVQSFGSRVEPLSSELTEAIEDALEVSSTRLPRADAIGVMAARDAQP